MKFTGVIKFLDALTTAYRGHLGRNAEGGSNATEVPTVGEGRKF